MFASVWHNFLYQPLFNLLIWIYNTWTDHNLGWAIVWVTVLLRTALLPLTIVQEYNNAKNREFDDELERVHKEFARDPILQKQEVRRVLKKRRVSPWSKIIVLGVQLLVLVLLYQVFVRGVTGDKILKILYPAVDFPGVINTNFYGLDLGLIHSWLGPGLVAIWLFIENYLEYHETKMPLQKSDLSYFFLFPATVFLALWLLPMVKSLFVLTSMAYSVIVSLIAKLIFRPDKPKAPAHH